MQIRRPARATCALLTLLLLALQLSGCAALKLYQEGVKLEEAGRYYGAAKRYVAALDINPDHKKAREALLLVAERAYEEKLGLAVDEEQNEAFAGALDEYQELDEFLRDLGRHDAADFSVVNVGEKIEEMANAAAEERYRAAENYLGQGKWEQAIGAYGAALSFKRGYKDCEAKIALAYYSWGDELEGAKYWRHAAQTFGKAVDHGGQGYKDASSRAGSLYLALGRYFIGADRCRQAVSDLRQARKYVSDGQVGEVLAEAEECAVTPVAVLPFENPTGTNVAGMALADTVSDATASVVRQDASEFVRMVERSALDQILSEQGLSAAGLATGSTSKVRGVRYLVLGKLTQVRFDHPGFSSQGKRAAGSNPYRCQKQGYDGKPYETWCWNQVSVDYQEHTGRIGLRVVGSVRVVDVKTGEQLATASLEAVSEDSAHFADSFSVGGMGVAVGRWENTSGVGVPDDVYALSQGKSNLKDEGQIASDVVTTLSEDAARAVLKVVDVEREARDPSDLVLVAVQ